MKHLFLCVLVFSLLANTASSSTCASFEDHIKPVGHFDLVAGAADFLITGQLLLVADDQFGLWTFDISDPMNPQLGGLAVIPGGAQGLAIEGNLVFVCGGESGLAIVDITNPLSPAMIGSVDTPGTASRLDLVGGYAYVADWSGGLQIIDVTVPSNPVIVGSVELPGPGFHGYGYDVVVVDSYAYIASGVEGLQIADVGDPANPFLAGSFDGFPGGSLHCLSLSNGRLYLVAALSYTRAGVVSMDITDPVNPVQMDSVETDYNPYGVTSPLDLKIKESSLFLTDWRGFHVIDISDPADLRVEGMGLTAESVTAFAVGDTLAYAALASGGVEIFNVGNPSSPDVLGFAATPGYASHVDVNGNHAYLASRETGLQVVDVSDEANPVYVGSVDTPGSGYGIFVEGALAYVADFDAGLQIVDISDPTSPSIIGSVDTPGYAWDVVVMDGYAYVADYDNVVVVDVSVPTAPFIVTETGGGAARMITASGSTLITTSGFDIVFLDVSTPGVPTHLGETAVPGYMWDIAAGGDFAFVACDTSGLQVVDFSDPTNPWIVGALDTPRQAVGIALAGNYGYVAESLYGMLVVDLEDPTAPVHVGGMPVPDLMADDLALVGGSVCLSAPLKGLYVLPGQCGALGGVGPVVPTVDHGWLEPACPNPFNPHTTIAFELPRQLDVSLRIFDLSGRLVRSLIGGETRGQGRHEVVWNGRDDAGRQVASGTYFYRLVAGELAETKSMVLVK